MVSGIGIDRRNKSPFYRQIMEGMLRRIGEGALRPGAKLPSERELAEELGIARGTVKKAYGELERAGIIDASRGHGSFVSSKQDLPGGRQEEALRLIDRTLDSLEELKFSFREIRTFMDLKIIEREEKRENLHVAAIDCNPETLSLYEKQLGFIAPVKIVNFLLDEIRKEANPGRRFKDFSIILTTATHYHEICGMLPGLKDKIMRVVFSPSQSSVIEISKIGASQKVGILCESKRFSEIILERLRNLNISACKVRHGYPREFSGVGEFLERIDVLIVPPSINLASDRHDAAMLQSFTRRGGKVIVFDYQIERGSLLYVEEKISEQLKR